MATAATRRRRARDDLTDSDSDVENRAPTPSTQPPAAKKTRRSLAKASSISDTSNSDIKELKEVFVKSEQKRDEHQKEMVATLERSTKVYEEVSEKYLGVLQQLVKQT